MYSYTVYVAEDGAEFETEKDCVNYENSVTTLLTKYLKTECDLKNEEIKKFLPLIAAHITEFQAIIHKAASFAKPEETAANYDWISNAGRTSCGHPETLEPATKIEVRQRHGGTATGLAKEWYASWCVQNHSGDIIAYRILKD